MNRQRMLVGGFFIAGMMACFALFSSAPSQAADGSSAVPSKGITLIMFEQDACPYCEIWDANIGVSYDKTREGKFAPLSKVDIHHDDDVPNVRPVVFTPTFVLYKDGKEVGRLTGYISDDFFWGLLNPMLKKHGYRDEDQANKGAEGALN